MFTLTIYQERQAECLFIRRMESVPLVKPGECLRFFINLMPNVR